MLRGFLFNEVIVTIQTEKGHVPLFHNVYHCCYFFNDPRMFRQKWLNLTPSRNFLLQQKKEIKT